MKYGWSLEPEDWTVLQKLLDKTDWSRTYLEREYKDNVPSGSGVYIICVNTKSLGNWGEPFDRLYNAIYVGQSVNLKNRFQDHVTGYKNVVKAKLTFRRLEFLWTEVAREEMSKYEQALINALGPSANEVNVIKAKIGDPIRI